MARTDVYSFRTVKGARRFVQRIAHELPSCAALRRGRTVWAVTPGCRGMALEVARELDLGSLATT